MWPSEAELVKKARVMTVRLGARRNDSRLNGMRPIEATKAVTVHAPDAAASVDALQTTGLKTDVRRRCEPGTSSSHYGRSHRPSASRRHFVRICKHFMT